MECWKNINHLYSQAWEVHNSWHFWKNKNIIFFSFSDCFLSPNVVVRLCSNFKSQVGLAKVSSAVNIRSSNLKSHNAPTTASGHTALRWPAARIEKDLRCWVGKGLSRIKGFDQNHIEVKPVFDHKNNIAFLMEKFCAKSHVWLFLCYDWSSRYG